MEIYKYITGYEGLYKITSKGNVITLGNGKSTNKNNCIVKSLKLKRTTNGYLSVKLFKDGIAKHHLVHRLVAKEFLINKDDKPQVNHIDGNKHNNEIQNLEWVTSSENLKHAFKIGLAKSKKGAEHKQSIKVVQMNKETLEVVKVWDSIKEIKRIKGYNTVGIIGCCKNRQKYNTAYGYKWKYLNKANV